MADRQGEGPAPYTVVLAHDVTLFTLEFWDAQKNEWAEEWLYTNRLPVKVNVILGTGKVKGSSSTPQDVVAQVIAIPAAAVGGLQRGPPGGVPGGGLNNQPVPNQPNPNQPNQPIPNPNAPRDRGRNGQDFNRPNRPNRPSRL